MTDIYDQASNREQLDRDLAVNSARKANPEALAIGHCLWCNAELFGAQRWCDADCREDWELAQEAGRRHRGRR